MIKERKLLKFFIGYSVSVPFLLTMSKYLVVLILFFPPIQSEQLELIYKNFHLDIGSVGVLLIFYIGGGIL